jgi:hypothetical protein
MEGALASAWCEVGGLAAARSLSDGPGGGNRPMSASVMRRKPILQPRSKLYGAGLLRIPGKDQRVGKRFTVQTQATFPIHASSWSLRTCPIRPVRAAALRRRPAYIR